MTHQIRRSQALRVTAGLAGVTLLSACGLGSGEGNGGDGGEGGAVATSITIDLPSYPSTLDPGLQYDGSTYPVYRNIYDQLIRRDSDSSEPVPWIAESWEEETPTTWRFQLRDDVTFSDGSPLTAHDAAFSLNRILDKALNSPQFANFSAVSKATAESDTELIIETSEPSPTLLTYLTTLSIVSQEYVDEVGDEGLNENPMGSGAYVMESARSGSEVTLTRNEDYWGEAPSIEKAVFRAVPDVSTRVADLRSGRAHLITTLSADQATELESQDGVQVLAVPTERVDYLALNTLADTPTQDANVRQAIAAAINYDSLIENLGGGYADPVGAVLTPLAFGYPEDATNYEYDPDRARQLLAEAGVPNPVLEFPASPAYDPQLLQAIQSDLQAVGFTVNITNTDHATYLQKVQDPSHNWGSVRFGRWSCSCLDADGVIYPLFRTGTVWSSFSNADFDAAVDRGRTTTDESERLAAYDEAWAILDSELPGIGLFQEYAIYGATADLQWQPDAVESMYLDQMSFQGDA